jgi:5-methyltetrahydropteroyltriglutamate--homocysteine methyltransferase
MNTFETTVIGSYPIAIDTSTLMDRYFKGEPISWEEPLNEAMQDFLTAGITMIADGQTRDPFITIFARKLEGCRIRNRPEVIDTIRYKGPITLEDLHYVKQHLPPGKKLVGLLAGPHTLSQSVVDLYYHDVKDLAFDFAVALHEEARQMQGLVDMISVDEPFFCMGLPDYAREIIHEVVSGLSVPVRLHACGDVTRVLPDILELPVDILSHEFKASPQIMDAFANYRFSQDICLGCVRSDDSRVEPIEEIIEHIGRAQQVFGEHIRQLAPDCGQRLLPRDVAFQKLRHMVLAGERIHD